MSLGPKLRKIAIVRRAEMRENSERYKLNLTGD